MAGLEPPGRARLKYLLLALLVGEPAHGYDLRSRWEAILGDVWPLSSSQVYTTLSQLEREGLVAPEVVHQERLPSRKVCHVTAAGREALGSWLFEVVSVPQQVRDDLVLKTLFALTPPVAQAFPPRATIARQRGACLRSLKELRSAREQSLDTSSQLLIEAAMIRIEGNLRWLDLCEESLEADA